MKNGAKHFTILFHQVHDESRYEHLTAMNLFHIYRTKASCTNEAFHDLQRNKLFQKWSQEKLLPNLQSVC